MKSNKFSPIWLIIVFFSLTLNGYLIYQYFAAKPGTTPSAISKQQPDLYVCPMHPQVVSDRPADCPICGMKLVKKSSNAVSDPALDSLIGSVNLSPTQELLANISVEHPTTVRFEGGFTVTGTIREIEGGRWKASSRTMGRIDKLFISNSGEVVSEGDPLFDLYSPDLASAAQEYLYILAHPEDDTLGERAEAIRGKLLSLGLEFEHLNEIARLNQAFDVYTFHAPRSGIVMGKMVSEGEWVMPGMTVIDFLDLSSVYVEGALLERDVSLVKIGTELQVTSISGEAGKGTVTLVGPMADMMTRTIPFRAILPNPGGKWTPGAFVTVLVGNTDGSDVLSVPEDAVLISGRGAVVWTKVGEGRFVVRTVVPGTRQNGRIAILDGLTEADAVAVTGAYLIDSDAQIRKIGAASMPGMDMTKPGAMDAPPDNSMSGMDMSQPESINSKSHILNPKLSYTCPMHPEVVSSEPGRCPKCGMFLVEKETGK